MNPRWQGCVAIKSNRTAARGGTKHLAVDLRAREAHDKVIEAEMILEPRGKAYKVQKSNVAFCNGALWPKDTGRITFSARFAGSFRLHKPRNAFDIAGVVGAEWLHLLTIAR